MTEYWIVEITTECKKEYKPGIKEEKFPPRNLP